MRRFAFIAFIGAWALEGCLGPVHEPPAPAYHNPLDVSDAGPVKKPADAGRPPGDAGLPPGANVSIGSVDGRPFELTSAVYQVLGGPDAGPERTVIYLTDAPDFCRQILDGGLAAPWALMSLHLAGDLPAIYPIGAVLAPEGATAAFGWEDDAGGFGFETGQAGEVNVEAVDPLNAQRALGSYVAEFGDAGSVAGRFTAEPCAGTPPTPGA